MSLSIVYRRSHFIFCVYDNCSRSKTHACCMQKLRQKEYKIYILLYYLIIFLYYIDYIIITAIIFSLLYRQLLRAVKQTIMGEEKIEVGRLPMHPFPQYFEKLAQC